MTPTITTYTVGPATVYRAEFVDDEAVPPGPEALSRRRERATVNMIVSEIFGPDASVEHAPDGSPRIAGIHNPPFISISHSARYAVIAACPTARVGIDIEHWRNSLMKVASRFLTPAEAEVYNSGRLLLSAWAIKEALYKVAETRPGRTLIDMPLPAGAGVERVVIDNRPVKIILIESTADTCMALAIDEG